MGRQPTGVVDLALRYDQTHVASVPMGTPGTEGDDLRLIPHDSATLALWETTKPSQ